MKFTENNKYSNNNDLINNGYTILPNIFHIDKLKILKQLTDRISKYADMSLYDPFSKYYLEHRSDQGALYDLYQRHPEFQEIAKCPEILDALELVLGKNIILYENSLVYKPKDKENAVPWHQDFISRPNEPEKYIAWVALDDVTKSNGALYVIPNSHKFGYLPWHRVKGETHHDRIDLSHIDENSATYIELNAGDVLIFNAKLVHSSKKTSTSTPRRAYRIAYQNIDSIETPRATPIVLRGGSPEDLANLYPEKKQDIKKPFLGRMANKLGRFLCRF